MRRPSGPMAFVMYLYLYLGRSNIGFGWPEAFLFTCTYLMAPVANPVISVSAPTSANDHNTGLL